MIIKPMRASDWVESKQRFPAIAQPKIDGVRALTQDGICTGRTLKKHANLYTTDFYSNPIFNGFDGEMAAASETDPALCRITTSALSTIAGEPFTVWWLFDFVDQFTRDKPYWDRLQMLRDQIELLPELPTNKIELIPSVLVYSMEEFLEQEACWLGMGFEGAILRNPDAPHKEGYSTVREGGLLRVKRFVEEEAYVLSIGEAEINENEATINALGKTERSSHKANKSPKGMLGNLQCKFLKSGKDFTCGPGNMTHEERTYYWNNQDELIQKIIKVKHFPKGIKDKPRFATFVSLRADSDM